MPSEQPREGGPQSTRSPEKESAPTANDTAACSPAAAVTATGGSAAISGEPAQPQPRGEGDDLAARLESEVIGYSISLGLTEAQFDLLREAASRLRTSTEGPTRAKAVADLVDASEQLQSALRDHSSRVSAARLSSAEGEARVDLATDLIGAADYLRDHGMAPRYEARCREAASALRTSTEGGARVEADNAIPVIGQFAPDTEMPLRREDWHYGAIRMGRRWYATRFHPSAEDNDGDLPEVGDTEFWENGKWHPYSIAAFQEREREAGLLGLARDESSTEGGARVDPGDLIYASAVIALRGDLTTIIEQDAAVGNEFTQVLAKQIVKKLDDALSDRPAQSEGGEEARVCEHARTNRPLDPCPICQPASPSEQTPTRVELRAAYEAGFEASGEGWNGEYLGPKVEYPACLDKGFAEWLSEQPASAPSEQREGEATARVEGLTAEDTKGARNDG